MINLAGYATQKPLINKELICQDMYQEKMPHLPDLAIKEKHECCEQSVVNELDSPSEILSQDNEIEPRQTNVVTTCALKPADAKLENCLSLHPNI